ncbi:hypothetical protein [Streptomyces sp. B8F3]|uniref:hypothetical protein n=1 Tax=unclassified Streptomyces TaxID=2593676 RepID=UPI00325F7E4C
MTDPRGVCAKRAENLTPGVPYIRGWAESKKSVDALAEMLTALGLETDFPSLKADVNIHGEGVVRLGPIRPAAAELLTHLLTAGLSAEMANQATAPEAPPTAPAA